MKCINISQSLKGVYDGLNPIMHRVNENPGACFVLFAQTKKQMHAGTQINTQNINNACKLSVTTTVAQYLSFIYTYFASLYPIGRRYSNTEYWTHYLENT